LLSSCLGVQHSHSRNNFNVGSDLACVFALLRRSSTWTAAQRWARILDRCVTKSIECRSASSTASTLYQRARRCWVLQRAGARDLSSAAAPDTTRSQVGRAKRRRCSSINPKRRKATASSQSPFVGVHGNRNYGVASPAVWIRWATGVRCAFRKPPAAGTLVFSKYHRAARDVTYGFGQQQLAKQVSSPNRGARCHCRQCCHSRTDRFVVVDRQIEMCSTNAIIAEIVHARCTSRGDVCTPMVLGVAVDEGMLRWGAPSPVCRIPTRASRRTEELGRTEPD